MIDIERYRHFFTKEYLMGPNSFRLLEELIRKSPADACFGRVLDLGCGTALTSVFLARETGAKRVFAFDLWICASDNYARILDHHLEDTVIPIHGDALDMPFSHEYFDAILSVDSYHYFGCKKGVFADRILPFVKKGGHVLIAVPGIKEEPRGALRELFSTWAEGDDALSFRTAAWWQNLLSEECGECCDIRVEEADCFADAWKDWFDTAHPFAVRDREFLEQGLEKILNFVLICVHKR